MHTGEKIYNKGQNCIEIKTFCSLEWYIEMNTLYNVKNVTYYISKLKEIYYHDYRNLDRQNCFQL